MGRRKAGTCKCGHELRRFHNDAGVCTYGANGPFAGACEREHGGPCAKPRRKKMNGTTKPASITTRPVTVNGDVILGALDACITATAAQLEALRRLRAELARGKVSKGGTTMSHVLGETRAAPRERVHAERNGTAAAVVRSDADSDGGAALVVGGMSTMRRRFLTVLAQHKKPMSRGLLLLHADYSSTGHTSKEFAAMIRDGVVKDLPEGLAITPAGLEQLGPYTPLPTGAKLLERLLAGDKLGNIEKAFLDVLQYERGGLTRGQLLERSKYSSTGHTSKAFARLIRFGYVHARGRLLDLSPELR